MMATLLLLVCLGSKCERVQPEMQPEGGMQACLVQAQMIAAKWQAEHPEWRVVKLSCRLGDAA